MNIVVLDGFTLNPGDLNWEELKTLGSCQIYDRTNPADVAQRASNAEIVLTNKTELTGEHLRALPRLQYLGILATGTNIVDLAAARARNIPVTNVPAYGTKSVAQATFALLLELAQHVGHHAETVRQGQWSTCADWCYWDYPLIELDGLTMGIVGFGRIGKAVGEIAASFGMKVVACGRSVEGRVLTKEGTPHPGPLPFRRGEGESLAARQRSEVYGGGLRFVDVETLFRESDVVSLHCPLTPETKHLVNRQTLSLMKPNGLLLNTSRGPLIDEAALAEALNSGRLAGAGLDVISVEPPPGDNPLLKAKNCIITPHLAWGTRAARSRLMKIAVQNVRAFLEGKPQNVVN
jgi:glycerate dehydrogenase